jgi:hypothetical protein
MPLYQEALPAHGQPAAGLPPGWQYALPAHGETVTDMPTGAQYAQPAHGEKKAGLPPGWQYAQPAHTPSYQVQGAAGLKLENLVFVSVFLVFLALFHAAAGSKVTYYLLWVILAGVVISRWPKINSFLRRYIT